MRHNNTNYGHHNYNHLLFIGTGSGESDEEQERRELILVSLQLAEERTETIHHDTTSNNDNGDNQMEKVTPLSGCHPHRTLHPSSSSPTRSIRRHWNCTLVMIIHMGLVPDCDKRQIERYSGIISTCYHVTQFFSVYGWGVVLLLGILGSAISSHVRFFNSLWWAIMFTLRHPGW